MSDLSYNKTKKLFSSLAEIMSYIPYFGFTIHEKGEIPKEPVILAINHKLKVLVNPFLKDRNKRTRWIDHLFVGIKYPEKVHFMVQNKQFMKSHTRKYLDLLETFPVQHAKKGLQYLIGGETVGVFPEGEAHKSEEGYFYKGIAWLSGRSKRKILPVYLSKNTEDINNVLHPKLKDVYIDYLTPLEPPKSTKKGDLEDKIEEFKSVFQHHKRLLYYSQRY